MLLSQISVIKIVATVLLMALFLVARAFLNQMKTLALWEGPFAFQSLILRQKVQLAKTVIAAADLSWSLSSIIPR